MRSRSTSRVVPGVAVTIAASWPASRLSRRRLAGVGPAGDDHCHALGQQPSLAARAAQRRKLASGHFEPAWSAASDSASISSSAKSIAASTWARSSLSVWPSERTRRGELTVERAHRGARCSFGSGIDQVGDGFGLRQIELAIKVGALRELARLRASRAELEQPADQGLDQHRAAVPVQLEYVLAGIGVRRREVQRQAVIDRLAVAAAKLCRGGDPRRRQRAEQAGGDLAPWPAPEMRTLGDVAAATTGGVAAAHDAVSLTAWRAARPRCGG